MHPTFRAATHHDAEAIRQLLGGLGHPARGLAHLEERLRRRDPRALALVAVVDGAVVGLLSAEVETPLAYAMPQLRVHALVVDDAHRRGGVALALARNAEAHAQTLGCFRVELTSAHALTEAHAFWESAGYTSSGLRFVRRIDGG